MKMKSYLLVGMAAVFVGCGNTPLVENLIGKTITIDYGFAGNDFSIKKDGNQYIGIRRILGSGVPVVKEIVYTIKVINNNAIEFSEIVTALSIEEKKQYTTEDKIEIDSNMNNKYRVVINGEEKRIIGIKKCTG